MSGRRNARLAAPLLAVFTCVVGAFAFDAERA